MTEKVSQIINKLKTRTLAREAVWHNTSRETEFQLLLPSGRITVDRWTIPDRGEVADFRIYNKEGREVAAEGGEARSADFQIIGSLHDAIMTRKFNVEETLTGIEKELEAKGTIGGEEEIPF